MTEVVQTLGIRPWRSLELYQECLFVCSDGGCQAARLQDIEDVIELLPALLMRQDRQSRGRAWKEMADLQRQPRETEMPRG